MDTPSTYKIKDRVADSRWSTLFTAEHKVSGQIVIVKFFNLKGPLADAVGTDVELIWKRRFALETKIMGMIRHPNVVPLLGYGTISGGRPCVIMPFIAADLTYELGPDIGDPALLARLAPPKRPKRMRPDRAFHVLRQMMRGVAALHDAGIIHRSLKPENVLMTRKKAGVPMICDFAMAKWNGRVLGEDDKINEPIHYVSPEQRENPAGVDPRADVYAMGAIAYRMLTSRIPQELETSVLDAGAQVSKSVDKLIQASLASDRAHRPANAAAMRAALDRAIIG